MTRFPSTASLADIAGLENFAGDVIDTAAWDASYDFANKRVAVIGTDVRAVEALPDLVRVASSVKVFQRNPAWIVPRVPLVGAAVGTNRRARRALALAHLRFAVADPWLRRQLTPSQTGRRCRPLVSSTYYPALQAANCTLITWPVYAVTGRGVRSAEGIEHLADCIVLATGGGPPVSEFHSFGLAHLNHIPKETA